MRRNIFSDVPDHEVGGCNISNGPAAVVLEVACEDNVRTVANLGLNSIRRQEDRSLGTWGTQADIVDGRLTFNIGQLCRAARPRQMNRIRGQVVSKYYSARVNA